MRFNHQTSAIHAASASPTSEPARVDEQQAIDAHLRKAERRSVFVMTLFASALTIPPAAFPANAQNTTSITVDGSQPGRTFDGVGAISGGGGNSRLLIDYPEPQRSQLLDYLFKPGYGASLQVLKIEIGGDANSTDGAEASHEHARGVIDCNQGYEWWLAEQAKARNPNIKLYGLAWGAPGWVGNGNFWSQDSIDYLTDWLSCAEKNNLTIDYLGGKNEGGYDKNWFESLRPALNAKGYDAVKVVAADSWYWGVADDMTTDPAFNHAVDIVGVHYPCGYLGNFITCNSSSNAQALGKPLWSSEGGSEGLEWGAKPAARALNRDYLDGKMTAFLNWPLIGALYPNLVFSNDGLATANQPWSGAYTIGKTLWAMAHTTQFTQPGWRYIDSASGYLGGDRANGSYVTLASPNQRDYSVIVETMDASAAQSLNIAVAGGLSDGVVHLWQTNLNSYDSTDYFVHASDITPVDGSYSLTLQPGYVYTISTTSGQGKGTAVSPAGAWLTLPYTDDFETPATSTSPKYFSDMSGAFAVTTCGGGRGGHCLRQMAPIAPMAWANSDFPYTIMGDTVWSNYTVKTDVMFAQPGSVEVIGRIAEQEKNNNGLSAYYFQVSDTGAWAILKTFQKWTYTTLKSGNAPKLGLNIWHTISLQMQDTTLTASIDGAVVGQADDATLSSGLAGLGVTGYQTDQFDNFAVLQGIRPVSLSQVRSGLAGKCLAAASMDNGAEVQLADCSGGGLQNWFWQNGTLRLGGPNGRCLDVPGHGTNNGTSVDLWDCNGGANQQWTPQANGSLVGVESHRCLDDAAFITTNGTQQEIWDCNGGANQKWTLP